MTKDKRPTPIVQLTGGRLTPVSAYDQEELAGFANGAEFDLKPRGKRSVPHNGLYIYHISRYVSPVLTMGCQNERPIAQQALRNLRRCFLQKQGSHFCIF